MQQINNSNMLVLTAERSESRKFVDKLNKHMIWSLETHLLLSTRHSLYDRYSETVSSSTTISSTLIRKYSHTPGCGLSARPTQGVNTKASCNNHVQ